MQVQHKYIQQGLFTPKNATSLLIGTFPSVLIREAFNRLRPSDVDFFYGSIDNNFWQDLSKIYKRSFLFIRSPEAIEQREALLNDLQMALSDIIFSCETTGSAMDTALANLQLNTSIIDVLDKTPTINKLYFTSSSGKVNAETLTLRMLRQEGRSSQMQIIQKAMPRQRQLLFTDQWGKPRPMQTITLYSPSPLAEQWGSVTAEKRIAQYQQWLPTLPHY